VNLSLCGQLYGMVVSASKWACCVKEWLHKFIRKTQGSLPKSDAGEHNVKT